MEAIGCIRPWTWWDAAGQFPLIRNQQVAGSSPAISTTYPPTARAVKARAALLSQYDAFVEATMGAATFRL